MYSERRKQRFTSLTKLNKCITHQNQTNALNHFESLSHTNTHKKISKHKERFPILSFPRRKWLPYLSLCKWILHRWSSKTGSYSSQSSSCFSFARCFFFFIVLGSACSCRRRPICKHSLCNARLSICSERPFGTHRRDLLHLTGSHLHAGGPLVFYGGFREWSIVSSSTLHRLIHRVSLCLMPYRCTSRLCQVCLHAGFLKKQPSVCRPLILINASAGNGWGCRSITHHLCSAHSGCDAQWSAWSSAYPSFLCTYCAV